MKPSFKVGDEIEWAKKTFDAYLPTKNGEGVILDKRGRNILVDAQGHTDWLYVPDLAWVRLTTKEQS